MSATDTSSERPSLLLVSSRSDPHAVAAQIANSAYVGVFVDVRAVGAGAVNQAMKACAIARNFAKEHGVELAVRPRFESVMLPPRNGGDGPSEERSAIVLEIFAT